MQKAIAIFWVVLISAPVMFVQSTAAVAWDRFPYCSKGFKSNETAYLLSGPKGWLLQIGRSIEHLDNAGSVGTGLNGTVVVKRGTDKTEAIYAADIQMDYNPGYEDKFRILIFRDRVFWPCKR